MKRTKLGKAMFAIMEKLGEALAKHPKLIYVLNYTWGILATLAGWIAYGFAKLFLWKNIRAYEKFLHMHVMLYGDNWGGLSLGMVAFISDGMGDEYTKHVFNHETGHSIQNAILGPLWIFLVGIPSAIRYWYQEIRKRKGLGNTPYDDAWWEGSASSLGNYYASLGKEKGNE